MKFSDRFEAGRKLADELKQYEGKDLLILGIPRGGVSVAKEVKKRLGGRLSVIIARKIGFPGNPEYGIGAVAQDGTVVLSEAGRKKGKITDEYLARETEKQKEEIERRMKMYKVDFPEKLEDKVVIVVDDGIATGVTVQAVLRFLKKRNPKKLILAVPVSPVDTMERLKNEVDELVCLHSPRLFFAVGNFYEDFTQVSDQDVQKMLEEESENE